MMSDTANDIANIVYDYGHLYGPQILLLAALGAITIFRRDLSCNACYAEHEVRSEAKSTEAGSTECDWDEEGAENTLEAAGMYCSGASLLPLITAVVGAFSGSDDFFRKFGWFWNDDSIEDAFCSGEHIASVLSNRRPGLPTAITVSSTSCEEQPNAFACDLPPDVQVSILSFLHPRDVTTFACISKSSRRMVEEGETSVMLWKNLWRRDFSWLVESWDIGRQAVQRSNGLVHFDKDFYFRFGLSYLNYVLAGHNSIDRCLVGLHGHIYDITPFLMAHPGSPETVMVQAGRDATSFFENVRHTTGARRLAQSLCVAVDSSCIDDEYCGVRPTIHTSDTVGPVPPVMEASIVTAPPKRPRTLQNILVNFLREQEEARQRATRRVNAPNMLGDVNVFYDAFESEFKAWYTTDALETVFLDQV